MYSKDYIKKINTYNFIIISIFFFYSINVSYLSLILNPFYAIPDEIGHLNYILDLYERNFNFNKSTLRLETTNFANLDDTNWIKNNHPPLYYFLGSLFYKLIFFMNFDNLMSWKVLRLLNLLLGLIFLIYLKKTLSVLKVQNCIIIFLLLLISFNPMFVHLSSGITNDILLLTIGTVSIYFYVLLIKFKNVNYLYISCLFLSLGSLTKETFYIPHFLMLIIFIFYHFKNNLNLKFLLYFTLINSLPLFWVIKNLLYNESFFSFNFTSEAADINFLFLLEKTTIISNFLISFFGQFGWIPYNNINGDINIDETLTISNSFIGNIFYISITLLIFSLIIYNEIRFTKLKSLVFFLIACFFYKTLYFKDLLELSCILFIFFLVILTFENFFYFFKKKIYFFRLSFFFIFIFFIIITLFQITEIYNSYGYLRATQGRYIYAVLPYLLIYLGLTLNKYYNFKLKNFLYSLSVVLILLYFHNIIYNVSPFYLDYY